MAVIDTIVVKAQATGVDVKSPYHQICPYLLPEHKTEYDNPTIHTFQICVDNLISVIDNNILSIELGVIFSIVYAIFTSKLILVISSLIFFCTKSLGITTVTTLK